MPLANSWWTRSNTKTKSNTYLFLIRDESFDRIMPPPIYAIGENKVLRCFAGAGGWRICNLNAIFARERSKVLHFLQNNSFSLKDPLVLNWWWKLRPPRANSDLRCRRKQGHLKFNDNTTSDKTRRRNRKIPRKKEEEGRRKEICHAGLKFVGERRRAGDYGGQDNHFSRVLQEKCGRRFWFYFIFNLYLLFHFTIYKYRLYNYTYLTLFKKKKLLINNPRTKLGFFKVLF